MYVWIKLTKKKIKIKDAEAKKQIRARKVDPSNFSIKVSKIIPRHSSYK